MELGKQIKAYRNQNSWNQDELAEKMFVSRQTISNWENDKSYPDIQSLLLLSELFEVSLDQLVKGDIEKMEEIVKTVNEKDQKDMQKYGKIMTVGLLVSAIVVVPLFLWLGWYALIPFGIIYVIVMYSAAKVEKIKKNNDVQTYKEILAFNKGESLDEITKQVEQGKRPYQRAVMVLLVSLVVAVIVMIMGVITFVVTRVIL